MPIPMIEKLLALQKCDARCDTIKHQLLSIPLETDGFKRKIDLEELAIEDSKKALKELEVRRHEMETEVSAEEEQAAKYKNQQLLVKKNEEYKALQHEIDTTASKIGSLEDKELELMLAIDEHKEKNAILTTERRQNIDELKGHIGRLQNNEADFKAELDSALEAVRIAGAELDENSYKIYKYVKTQVKHPPFVVPLRDRQCTGCFLKVSNNVATSARHQDKLHRCDNCGRIVYFEK